MIKRITVDTNILFSALLNINSRIGQILLMGYRYYDFFAPQYIRFEILEHQSKIKKIAGINDDQFIELNNLVLGNIKILNHKLIPLEFYKRAEKLSHSIDPDDTAFIAITDYTRSKLWTGDKSLINGLKAKGYDRVISTNELFNDFLHKKKSKI
jgi:predicted nucleic acid-binding protein